jgi:dTDP-4-dehydrorhamnose 3,5-epimerase
MDVKKTGFSGLLVIHPKCCDDCGFFLESFQAERYRESGNAAVDLRADSATFGRWYGVELSDEGPRQLYMAPGFAHGFCVPSEFADCTTR